MVHASVRLAPHQLPVCLASGLLACFHVDVVQQDNADEEEGDQGEHGRPAAAEQGDGSGKENRSEDGRELGHHGEKPEEFTADGGR